MRELLANSLIAVADQINGGVAKTIADLRESCKQEVVLLTGDDCSTAHDRRNAGMSEVHSDLLPQDKVAAIESGQCQDRRVYIVGDGVYDAPALAAAYIGIAMGALGSDVAIETADVALTSDDTVKIPQLLILS